LCSQETRPWQEHVMLSVVDLASGPCFTLWSKMQQQSNRP